MYYQKQTAFHLRRECTHYPETQYRVQDLLWFSYLLSKFDRSFCLQEFQEICPKHNKNKTLPQFQLKVQVVEVSSRSTTYIYFPPLLPKSWYVEPIRHPSFRRPHDFVNRTNLGFKSTLSVYQLQRNICMHITFSVLLGKLLLHSVVVQKISSQQKTNAKSMKAEF